MGYDKEALLERYHRWKTRYEACGGKDPCIHKMFEEDNLLQIIQHDNKIYAGEISQEKQHENILIIGL